MCRIDKMRAAKLSDTVSDRVAEQVSTLRRSARLTREQFSARCRGLGLDLSPAALTNIETGRRDSTGRRRREVSVDELVVLAAALNVPPLQLMYPLGAVPKVEMLPGVTTETWTAYRWAYGEQTRITDSETDQREWWRGRADQLDAYQRHTDAAGRYLHHLHGDDLTGDSSVQAGRSLRDLVQVREDMARRGWSLPVVPADLTDELTSAQQRHRQERGMLTGTEHTV